MGKIVIQHIFVQAFFNLVITFYSFVKSALYWRWPLLFMNTSLYIHSSDDPIVHHLAPSQLLGIRGEETMESKRFKRMVFFSYSIPDI